MIDFTTNPDYVSAGRAGEQTTDVTDVKQLKPSALLGSFSDYRPTHGSKTAVLIRTTSREEDRYFRAPPQSGGRQSHLEKP